MTFTAGTNVIPSDEISVTSSTVRLSPSDFEKSVGFMGTADLSATEGNATPNEVYRVQNSKQATDLFGSDSELTRQIDLAYTQGTGQVYAVAVEKTTGTEEFTTVTSGTVTDAPLVDPVVSPSSEITETNSGETINIVYEQIVTTPTDGINLNPITGDWEAATSGTYTIEYDTVDFTDAIQSMSDESPRMVAALTDDVGVFQSVDGELQNDEKNFVFSHSVGCIRPKGADETTSEYITDTETLSVTSNRSALVASSRGYTDASETEEVRMNGVAASMAASKNLGNSITSDQPSGILSLRDSFTVSELGDLLDNGVMAIGNYGGIKVIQDKMTATEAGFKRLFANEVTDESVSRIHDESAKYIGEQSTDTNINNYNRALRNQLLDLQNDTPPKLDGFNIQISQATDGDLDVTIVLDVVDIIDNISVDAIVGDIVSLEVSA